VIFPFDLGVASDAVHTPFDETTDLKRLPNAGST
jgi:hypothetical protein